MPAPIFAKRARSACYLAYNHIVCLVGAYSVTQSGGTRARGAACHPKRRRTDSRLLLRRKIMRACVYCLLVWHGVFRKGLDGDMHAHKIIFFCEKCLPLLLLSPRRVCPRKQALYREHCLLLVSRLPDRLLDVYAYAVTLTAVDNKRNDEPSVVTG